MNPVLYTRVGSVEAALHEAQAHRNALFIAGGTTVVDLMREGVYSPDVLIDIGALPLREIWTDRDTTRVGALVTNADLAWHPAVRALFPAVSQALLAGASGQIRNMATVSGNLLQRTRCPYFRDLNAGCNKRTPGSGCSAIDGYNRSHAVLGVTDSCIATHASDFTVALTALEASVQVAGRRGKRDIPISEFFLLPGTTPETETSLEPGELILGITLPNSPLAQNSLYLKVRDRRSYEFALASVAVAVEMEGDFVKQSRVVFGGISTIPWRAPAAEQVLNGRRAELALFQQAADEALAGARSFKDNAFKVPLARRTLVSALQSITGARS